MNKALSELFQVTGRFRRSVHLERDFYTENALDGYVVTVTAREILRRLSDALTTNEKTSRAWSLTGPYGSGKSAFALFTAKLLGDSESPTTRDAQDLLKRGDESLWNQFRKGKWLSTEQGGQGFCPVLISGERAPITLALLRGLTRSLTAFSDIAPLGQLLEELEKQLKGAENGGLPRASEITHLFESATHEIGSNGGAGLLLVVDELGKFLEYAAQNPAHGDLFVLQSLAEFATRSEQTPFLMLTILHQAFEQYAQRLANSQREEWAKVQGRFEDVAFVEPTEQVLRLIGNAIERVPTTDTSTDRQSQGKEGDSYSSTLPILSVAVDLKLQLRQLEPSEFVSLLENCLPLHPTVALIVSALFRRFAQNERSLFALLNSSEPHGLQDFLANRFYDGRVLPTFTLSDLYDYINTAFGNRLYASGDGKRWAEIESAIERLPNPSPMTVKLIKTIGLLGVVGEVSVNLKASMPLLRYALDDGTETFHDEFERALAMLAGRSIAIYRRYNDAYALWEGSDIDIETRLREAGAHLDPNLRLTEALSELVQPRPLIARRHLFRTGTMRCFTLRYTDAERFDADLELPFDLTDGLVLYALPATELEVEQLIEKATQASVAMRNEVLIAIPQSIGFLRDAVLELARLQWVEKNTPELAGDATARRELSTRLAEVEREVSEQLTLLFSGQSFQSGKLASPQSSNLPSDWQAACTWYHNGEPTKIASRRALNEYLSEICDAVYNKTPILRNELINRQQISGQASSARRKLISGMLGSQRQEKLGIDGYPPEMSIYLSLLVDTGIHRPVSEVWGFHPPITDDKNGMSPTWSAIEGFLSECEVERQSVAKLYERLEKPPFGLRSGPLPILLCAVLLHYEAELALYEEGSFVADISMAVFERLIKSPEKFELKRFRIEGIRADVFEQFTGLLSQPQGATDHPNLLAVVKPLIRFVAKLPRYTILTQELSDAAISLRKAIADAREPDALLFEQLPQALGFPAFGPSMEADITVVNEFFKTLRGALSELARAYDGLLDFIEQLLVSAFSLKGTGEENRVELFGRAQSLFDITVETRLKGFFIRVCDEGLDFKGWLEAIGTYIVTKPPAAWTDLDKAHFETNLSELAKRFHRFEAVSFERQKRVDQSTEGAGEVIRVGITTLKPPEGERSPKDGNSDGGMQTHDNIRVVAVPPTTDGQAEEIEREIEAVFKSFGIDGNLELRLAVLARISQKLMEQLEEYPVGTAS
jgi:hypothetical protein